MNPNKLIVSPSPHVHSKLNTRRLMLDVIIALIPALLVSIYIFGLDVLYVTGVSVASCMLFEWAIGRFMLGQRDTLRNFSAVLTGMLLAFNLPSNLPLWMVVVGALVAIGIGKMSFGGLGRNPFNPALVGRVFLLISFPVAMTTYPSPVGVDAFSGSTPLTFVKEALKSGVSIDKIMTDVSFTDILMGYKAGSFGEIASWALMIGFAYLLWRRVITWHIPVVIVTTIAVFSGVLFAIDPQMYMNPLFHVLTGGVLLGSIFMATDYVTSPMTVRGMVIYAIGIGLITIIIRLWGAYPEGISFAILIMNAVTPLINKYVKPKRFGV